MTAKDNRKLLKKTAKQHLKKHYVLFVALCFIAAVIGVEFTSSLDAFRTTKSDFTDTDISSTTDFTYETQELYDILFSNYEEHISDAENQEVSEKLSETEGIIAARKQMIFGRDNGVLASVVNNISSAAYITVILQSIENLGASPNFAIGLVLVFSFVLHLLFRIFIKNPYMVILRRYFMESRIYEKSSLTTLLHFQGKRWVRMAATLMVQVIFEFLWMLTIIGYFIKLFSYCMVPYIVAENPDIKPLDAITLSRNMMNGHKWECFVYELTFLGWYLLGILTFGLSDLLFTNAYHTAFYTEIYVQLRQQAKEKNLPNAEQLNDMYLYASAPQDLLDAAYPETAELLREDLSDSITNLRGVRGFLANTLGISVASAEQEAEYDRAQLKRQSLQLYQNILAGKSYPIDLVVNRRREKTHHLQGRNYMRHYSIPSLILLFFSFSLLGWIWEVTLHLVVEGSLVNRGVLHGPWLPIYGSGAILALMLLSRMRSRPLNEFFSAVILSGCVEYFTAWLLAKLHNGMEWWDYSGYFLNINGRICAEGLLVFGLGCMGIVYFAAPILDNWFRKLKMRHVIVLCIVLLALFGCDEIYSSHNPNTGAGITDYPENTAYVDHLTERSV